MTVPQLLDLKYDDLRIEVGNLLGFGREVNKWTPEAASEIDAIVQSGYRMFLYPPVQQSGGHQWSFLRPIHTMTVKADVGDYDLPYDFGGMVGDITFKTQDEGWRVIKLTNEQRIRERRQRSFDDIASFPLLAATQPIATDGRNRQRYRLMLHPAPDSTYDISFRYEARPMKLTVQHPYPLGGPEHAETIMEACLSLAERRMDDTAGPHTQRWIEQLASSLNFDRKRGPEHFGYNGDDSDYETRRFPYYRTNNVTYEGVLYEG